MKKIAILLLCGILATAFSGCDYEETEEYKRLEKTELSKKEGLNRTISVYSNDGTLLREYHGKVDIQENDYGNKVLFDNDGRRYIIYGGTVIIEED